MTLQERQRVRSVLEASRDGDALEAAAVSLARAEDAAATADLGWFLGRREGLARLDDLGSPSFKTIRLSHVLEKLAQHPSPSTAEICLQLLRSPEFLEDEDRKIFLLPALAAVRPMNEETAEVIRETNAQGYYNLNVRLLPQN